MAKQTLSRDLIVLARQSRMLTQSDLAKAAGISQAQVSKIENGLDIPDEETVKRLAAALNYRPSFFYQRADVRGFPPYHHRKRSRLGVKVLDAIHAQLNIRRMHLETLVRSAEIAPPKPLPALDPAQFGYDGEDMARTLREHWMLPRGPIANVVDVVENAGVVVIACNFGTDLLDGLSFRAEGLPPLIFIRSDLPGDRMRFTLVHELAHLVMHFFTPGPDEMMEKQADLFAGAFLLPEADIMPYLTGLSLHKLMLLKQVWGVSMQAILYRAGQLGTIDARQKDSLWRQLSRAGYRKHEPVEIKAEQPKLITEIVEVHLDDLGYSVEELSKALHIEVAEFAGDYLRGVSRVRAIDGAQLERPERTRDVSHLRQVK